MRCVVIKNLNIYNKTQGLFMHKRFIGFYLILHLTKKGKKAKFFLKKREIIQLHNRFYYG